MPGFGAIFLEQELAKTRVLLNLPTISSADSDPELDPGAALLDGCFKKPTCAAILSACGFLDPLNYDRTACLEKIMVLELEAGCGEILCVFLDILETKCWSALSDIFVWKGFVQSSAKARRDLVRQLIEQSGESYAAGRVARTQKIWSDCRAALQEIEIAEDVVEQTKGLNFMSRRPLQTDCIRNAFVYCLRLFE